MNVNTQDPLITPKRGISTDKPASDNTIIFPFISSTNSIDRRFYSSVLTDGRADYYQIDQTLQEIDGILQQKLGVVRIVAYILITIMFLGFFGMFVLIALLANDSPSVIGIVMGSYFLLVVIAVTALTRFTKRRYKQARLLAQDVLDVHNPKMIGLGLRWRLPLHFPKWIELLKEYKNGIRKIDAVIQESSVNNEDIILAAQLQYEKQGFIENDGSTKKVSITQYQL